MTNESLQAAMAIWLSFGLKDRSYPGLDESRAAFALANAFAMEHHPDLRDRMACNRCDLKAECEFALKPYNLDCEPKIDCLATK